MSLENISTFEHDVKKELEAKEATTRSVAAASNDVGNKEKESPKPQTVSKKPSSLPLLVGVLIFTLTLGGGGYAYITYLSPPANLPLEQETSTAQAQIAINPEVKKEVALKAFSPTLTDALSMFISDTSKTQTSVTLRISDFSSVYAYITRNEKKYADEVALALNVPHDTKDAPVFTTLGDEPQVQAPSVSSGTNPLTLKNTTSASSLATSSFGDTVVEIPQDIRGPQVDIPFSFSDITINNQNIRIATSGKNTFYYAFIGKKALVFATTIEELFAQKSAILR